MKFSKLTTVQIDALREIGNIGAGNAATAMSKLINKKIEMQVPSVCELRQNDGDDWWTGGINRCDIFSHSG